MWLIMAILSAVFAGLTSILAKTGIKTTDSDVATALRTIVVLLFSWIMVLIVGSYPGISEIQPRSFLFLILSGLATGASWICYFKALSMADINKVVPVDKSSTILSVILAMIFFQETANLPLRILAVLLIGLGIFLMIEKKDVTRTTSEHGWFLYALLSAVFAALTSLLAKIGITNVESNLGTAIRTMVVLLMAWGIVLKKKKQGQISKIPHKELLFICLSGIATGASWLCYYYAIQKGVVSVVVPIDKLSILVTVLFSYLVFGERLKKRSFLGLLSMVAGTLLMVFAK